jgi:hypothetical protein
MTRTLLISVSAFFMIAGVWAANLVCYHPQQGLDPMSPISITADWK